jgi:hypothetical protein
MAYMFNKGLYYLLDSVAGGRWNDTGLTFKCALVTSSYTFNPAHNWWSEITGECTNPNYAAGGNPILSRTITEEDGTNQIKLDAADTTFSGLGAGTQPYAAVVYHATGVASTSQLICYNRLTEPPAPDGNNFTVVWNETNGIFRVTNT